MSPLFRARHVAAISRKTPTLRPNLEVLEDRSLLSVMLLSENLGGTDSGNGYSTLLSSLESPDYYSRKVSADGRYVVFNSRATDLTADPEVGTPNAIFVRDLQTNQTELVSVSITGKALWASQPVISGNGRYVAFIGYAANSKLPDGITDNPDAFVHNVQFAYKVGGNGDQVYVRDLLTNETRLATIWADGQGSYGGAAYVTITDGDDGTSFGGVAVAFSYGNDDLSPNDGNGLGDVYIHYFTGNQNVLASRTPGGASSLTGPSYAPVLSSDGSRVSFLSEATDLTAMTDNNNSKDLFSFQTSGNQMVLVSASASGGFAANTQIPSYRVDASGQRFVFHSPSDELVTGANTPNAIMYQLFLRDITTGQTTLISRLPNGNPAPGTAGYQYDISYQDGSYVAFLSSQRYTDDGDPGYTPQVWVYDVTSNCFILATRNLSGGPATGDSHGPPVLSGDGRYVLFISEADNLVANFTKPSGRTIYVRDILANRTVPLSTNAAGTIGVDNIVQTNGLNRRVGSSTGVTAIFASAAPDGSYGFTDTNGGNPTDDIMANIVSDVAVPPISVTVNQAADQADPTSANQVRFTVEFSLPVNGIDPSKISFAGSTVGGTLAAAVSTRDHRIYTVTVTGMTSSGEVVLSLQAGAGQYRTGPVSQASTSADNRVQVNVPIVNVPVVGDWTGNGRDKIGVFRNGQWILDSNGSGTYGGGDWVLTYGRAGDIPVVGDWNGDGRDDIGVFRNGQWILDSNGSFRYNALDWVLTYGRAGDIPVVGDWNGDRRDDIGVFRNGQWILDRNGTRRYDALDWVFAYGQAGDKPVVGDWNGDGRDEVGVFRNGLWILDRNGTRRYDALDGVFTYGRAGDLPVVGDWNGNRRGKIGYFRNGQWVLDSNGSGRYEATDWIFTYG